MIKICSVKQAADKTPEITPKILQEQKYFGVTVSCVLDLFLNIYSTNQVEYNRSLISFELKCRMIL